MVSVSKYSYLFFKYGEINSLTFIDETSPNRMESWCIYYVAAIWLIFKSLPLCTVNAEQCLSPNYKSNFVELSANDSEANLFRNNSRKASEYDKVCVVFSAIRTGIIWNLTIKYAENESDRISQFVANLKQYSAFGLRDSNVIFIEACDENGRFGIEESGGPLQMCEDINEIINSSLSFEVSLQVAFRMPAIADPKGSSWYRPGKLFGPSMIKASNKERKKHRRNESGVKSSSGSVFGFWAFGQTGMTLIYFFFVNIEIETLIIKFMRQN